MSEKRFVQLGDTHIKDTLTGEEWYAPCETSLLELLNEQEAIIEAKDSLLSVLSKENEQLRKELDNFKPVMFQDVRKGTVILYSKGD